MLPGWPGTGRGRENHETVTYHRICVEGRECHRTRRHANRMDNAKRYGLRSGGQHERPGRGGGFANAGETDGRTRTTEHPHHRATGATVQRDRACQPDCGFLRPGHHHLDGRSDYPADRDWTKCHVRPCSGRGGCRVRIRTPDIGRKHGRKPRHAGIFCVGSLRACPRCRDAQQCAGDQCRANQ